MHGNSFLLFTLGPVQSFIKAARTVRDLWSGSYLLSYLTFRAMEAVAEQSGKGADAIVFPNLAELPLWKWKHGQLESAKKDSVLEPCIPNRFLAEVPADQATDLAERAEGACRKAWKEIAGSVCDKLKKREVWEKITNRVSEELAKRTSRREQFDPGNLWNAQLWETQIEQFFEVYVAVLPQEKYTATHIEQLLGAASANEWSDRHQIAQKMLAAVKGRRHFPLYAPRINGDVPQKDTLLGTLEHLGPGNRQGANVFWEVVAKEWHSHGSKVTRREKLCAVSLVKRYAWAHYFAPEFGYEDRRELKFQDTATIAAKKWLTDGPNPRDLLHPKKDPLWSGQWLHWPTQKPPKDDEDEDPVPPNVWNALEAKKATQGKPPSYYAVFVFDGDKMGDRFNAAPDADTYRAISSALANFALDRIKGIVEGKHHGELIYAGGDDAICLLPTETALACAQEINQKFHENWDEMIKPIAHKLPEKLRKATISGGLVVAHYKEDLRFVMEQAHEAEKASKSAGRDALTVTICRRSGEHSSAVVPWKFVPTVIGWVDGFLAKASDRWAYKLRADLPVFESDPKMFKSELGRQLGRSEEATRKLFPVTTVASFDTYLEQIFNEKRQKERKERATEKVAITDFVTLLQTASFLARGRDA